MLVSSYGFWLIFGMVLIILEVVSMGFVAVFFGLGAIIVGALTWLGIIDHLTWQLLIFAFSSVFLLLVARRRFQLWLKGDETKGAQRNSSDLIGQRVEVVSNFSNGRGTVFFRGAQWQAYSNDELINGDSAWIVDHSSITLTVSRQPQ